MGINYAAAATIGEDVLIEAVARKVGRTLAFSDCYFRDPKSGYFLKNIVEFSLPPDSMLRHFFQINMTVNFLQKKFFKETVFPRVWD